MSVTNSGCNPGDFSLRSLESRAAMRARLTLLPEDRDWTTLYQETSDLQITFGAWEKDGTSMVRIVQLPSVWATASLETIPTCPGCGEPFAEQGKFRDLTCFQPTCLERHDPEPPPKNRPRPGHTITELEKTRARETFAKVHAMEAGEVEDFSATAI
jgi:hypothetical protein